jgi:hypothetical protein
LCGSRSCCAVRSSLGSVTPSSSLSSRPFIRSTSSGVEHSLERSLR